MNVTSIKAIFGYFSKKDILQQNIEYYEHNDNISFKI